MANTDIQYEKSDIRFRSSDTTFTNSQCLFIEYMDVIQMPWFSFLSFLQINDKLNNMLNIDMIKYLNPSNLLEFYINRKNKNILVELCREKYNALVLLDNLLKEQMRQQSIFYQYNLTTNMCTFIQNIAASKLVKKILIYYEENIPAIDEDIKTRFGNFAEYVWGPMPEVLKNIPNDSTYIFSDVMNIIQLEENDKLDYSAILIPVEFRYNYVDDNKTKYLVDIDNLLKSHVFKWGTFKIVD